MNLNSGGGPEQAALALAQGVQVGHFSSHCKIHMSLIDRNVGHLVQTSYLDLLAFAAFAPFCPWDTRHDFEFHDAIALFKILNRVGAYM